MTKFYSLLAGVVLFAGFQISSLAQTITNQPQSLTVNYASSAMFTVGATNATNYQWRLNGSPVSDTGSNMYNPGSISGSTNAVLYLENVTSNEIGNYSVVINGTLTSSNAALSVIPGTALTLTFSGLLTNAQSNMVLQLFDHDKPATVQNFLHYVRSGVWSNMFMQRCIPGFVLQGGSYDTSDRTNTNAPLTGWDVKSEFVISNNEVPRFPFEIASEYFSGPTIKNDFGTVAMGLQTSFFTGRLTNSAENGFFFNLADNSGSPNDLDVTQAGAFTVFGRVINTGTNVLNYFNSLPTNETGGGIVQGNSFIDSAIADPVDNPIGFTDLAVNYTNYVAAGNANVVYCDFSPTNVPADTVPPSVAITSPAASAILTNAPVLQGTASDDVGLADIICTLVPQVTDGKIPNAGQSVTNLGFGANWAITNYDLDLDTENYYSSNGYIPPGTYLANVQSQDGAGNLSTNASRTIIVTGVMTNGNGTVSFLNAGLTGYPAIGYPMQEDGTVYQLEATPASNNAFLNWSDPTGTNIYSEIGTVESDGQLLVANFISNNAPNAVVITAPATNSVFNSGPFNISGTIGAGLIAPVTVTVSIFSAASGNGATSVENPYTAMAPLVTTGSNAWTVSVTNTLYAGSYIVQALAVDSSSNMTVVTNSFTVSSIKIVGGGSTALYENGTNLTSNPVGYPLQYGTVYTLAATPAAGQTFVGWSYENFMTSSKDVQFEYSGGLWAATFVSSNVPKNTKDIVTFTYPTANAKLRTNNFIMKGRIAASVKSAQITFHIFSINSGLVEDATLMTSGTNTWSVPVTNLPPDTYLVEAVATNATGGWSQVVSENFSILDFKPAAGTYSGLFLCTNGPVAATNSGFLTFTLGASGAVTGRLQFPGYRPITFNGSQTFYADGTLGFYYTAFSGNPFYASMTLDLTGGSGSLTGVVASTNRGSWISPLVCYKDATKLSADTTPAKDKYVLKLAVGSSQTNGYATINAQANGALALSGALPDGSTFSESARVWTNGTTNAIWPLYVTPSGYGENGFLMGWETNQSNTNFTGQLYWYKKSGVGAYYTSGISTSLMSFGTNYSSTTEPAAGTYALVFQGGAITTPLTNSLTVTRAGGPFKLTTPSSNPNKLTIALTASGVLSGHFTLPSSGKAVQFKGAFFGQVQGGSGFILEGNDQTGTFTLREQP